ncbi:60S ribosomal protein L35 [Echinococcus granulosus]|uniref:Large ribosomal subunit protein uL29 n=1 Tax=Echinococcus granulosus TaxID=6210 RepID=W6UJ00_ECHGR|nr:60S ribosomal protein L35 [Echinococcus granulosus]EUB61008.1 60S ribosomal protein L35 [Echinococcus granulosus]
MGWPLRHVSSSNPLYDEQSNVRASDLRTKPEAELLKQLGELKTELANQRLFRITRGAASKLRKIRVLRKSIARIYTVMNQAAKLRQREAYRKKRYVPKDLRPKKTRAIRRRLKKSERSIHSEKMLRKMRSYPTRQFALMA